MKRRAIIVLLAAVMTVGVFAGCKGSNESDSAKTEETADGGAIGLPVPVCDGCCIPLICRTAATRL